MSRAKQPEGAAAKEAVGLSKELMDGYAAALEENRRALKELTEEGRKQLDALKRWNATHDT